MMTKEEFQKTLIRMWDSLREEYKYKGKTNCVGVPCDRCPLYDGDNMCGSKTSYRAYDIISIVEKWGKEHPIDTNREAFAEALREKFGDKINLNVLNSMLNEQGCNLINGKICNGDCNACPQGNFWDKEYQEVSKDANKN